MAHIIKQSLSNCLKRSDNNLFARYSVYICDKYSDMCKNNLDEFIRRLFSKNTNETLCELLITNAVINSELTFNGDVAVFEQSSINADVFCTKIKLYQIVPQKVLELIHAKIYMFESDCFPLNPCSSIKRLEIDNNKELTEEDYYLFPELLVLICHIGCFKYDKLLMIHNDVAEFYGQSTLVINTNHELFPQLNLESNGNEFLEITDSNQINKLIMTELN